jgi:Na+-transporting methylmalonyl-CoA/oxaloacetate decarboxylase gamma subunit
MLVILMASVALAGNSYDLSFESGPTQAIYLIEGDEVRFELLGDEHSLIMEGIGSTSVKLDFAPFLNDGDSSMFTGLLLLDTTMKLDLDKDGIADLNVALYSVSEEYEAHLVLQDASVSASDLITGLVTGDEVDEGNPLSNYVLGAVGVAIVLLLAFLFFREKGVSKEEKKEEVKEEESEEVKEESSEEVKEEVKDKPKVDEAKVVEAKVVEAKVDDSEDDDSEDDGSDNDDLGDDGSEDDYPEVDNLEDDDDD